MVLSLSWAALIAVSNGNARHHGVESPSLLQSVVNDRHSHPHKGNAIKLIQSHDSLQRIAKYSSEFEAQLQKASPNALIQSHHSLQRIEKYVSELEVQLQKASPNATNVLTTDELKMLQDLITALDAEFVVELVKQSDADKAAFLRKKASHEACHTHLQTRLAVDTGDVWKAEQQISTRRAKHKACRRAEKSLISYTDQATPVGGGMWGNLARVTGQTQLAQHETLCSSRATFVSDLSDYEDSVPTGTISTSCGEDQMQLETGTCNWLQAKISACIGFDECLVSVGLATLKSETVASSINRKALFLSIEKLKCRLQHVYDAFVGGASSFTTPDTCGDTLDPEPTKFTLTLEVPTYAGCSSDTDIVDPVQPSIEVDTTCTDWRQREFNADANVSHTYDLEYHTPVELCKTSCELPTQIGSANIVQGCVDRNDVDNLCPFYSVHFDACGLYNDNATSICCACGGGLNPCDAIEHCSGHGSTTDMVPLDGCDCTCTDGYTGPSCATPPVCDTTRNIALKTEGANCTRQPLPSGSLYPHFHKDNISDCSPAIDGTILWDGVSGIHMGSNNSDPWLIIEFPQKMNVDVIKMYQVDNFALSNIMYQTRDNDGVAWTTQFTKTTSVQKSMEPVQLVPNVVTDAVRMVFSEKTEENGIYRIMEIQVEGCSPPTLQ